MDFNCNIKYNLDWNQKNLPEYHFYFITKLLLKKIKYGHNVGYLYLLSILYRIKSILEYEAMQKLKTISKSPCFVICRISNFQCNDDFRNIYAKTFMFRISFPPFLTIKSHLALAQEWMEFLQIVLLLFHN